MDWWVCSSRHSQPTDVAGTTPACLLEGLAGGCSSTSHFWPALIGSASALHVPYRIYHSLNEQKNNLLFPLILTEWQTHCFLIQKHFLASSFFSPFSTSTWASLRWGTWKPSAAGILLWTSIGTTGNHLFCCINREERLTCWAAIAVNATRTFRTGFFVGCFFFKGAVGKVIAHLAFPFPSSC